MTIPWMQNEDFGSVDGRVEDSQRNVLSLSYNYLY